MNVNQLNPNLYQDDLGIWRSERSTSAISYPEDGNLNCFQIEDDSFWFQHRNECISTIVRRFPPTGILLDVGGGNGFVTRRLLDDGVEAILLEPGAAGAFNAKTYRQIPNVICSTLEDAHFPAKSVSAVGFFDVLEHIPDDDRFIQLIHTILTDHGLIYGTVPAYSWLWSFSDVRAGHFRRYTFKTLQKCLLDRFEMVFFTYFFQPLIVPIFLLRTLPFRLRLFRNNRLLSSTSEHGTSGGVDSKLIRRLLRPELAKIKQGKTIPTGTSCLFVARKNECPHEKKRFFYS